MTMTREPWLACCFDHAMLRLASALTLALLLAACSSTSSPAPGSTLFEYGGHTGGRPVSVACAPTIPYPAQPKLDVKMCWGRDASNVECTRNEECTTPGARCTSTISCDGCLY